jgi:hypothetical protein
MFSLFFGSNVINFFFSHIHIQKLLQTHAKARHQQQPRPHAKKTLLSLQYVRVMELAQPQLVKLALPRVITKEFHNGQIAKDPMSLKL